VDVHGVTLLLSRVGDRGCTPGDVQVGVRVVPVGTVGRR